MIGAVTRVPCGTVPIFCTPPTATCNVIKKRKSICLPPFAHTVGLSLRRSLVGQASADRLDGVEGLDDVHVWRLSMGIVRVRRDDGDRTLHSRRMTPHQALGCRHVTSSGPPY